MRKSLILFALLLLLTKGVLGQNKTIHVFVALCDNQFQGIVPVPSKLGNGKDPAMNLYWGAMYGVKSFFKYKADDWKLVKTFKTENSKILERVLFKNEKNNTFMLADAYDGEFIKQCTEAFLKATNCQNPIDIDFEGLTLSFGGNSNLVAYCGHDGLMDFDVNIDYKKNNKKIDVVILACYSKEFFKGELKKAGANPLLWTTHLMAPEAYTLKAAFDGWMANETGLQVEERAAQAYNKYQKCGIKGARNLFATGY